MDKRTYDKNGDKTEHITTSTVVYDGREHKIAVGNGLFEVTDDDGNVIFLSNVDLVKTLIVVHFRVQQ